jgi:tRNA threonylcarbamoyladenosine modification (KEOPS) complex  Pcc1 subunit
MVSAKPPDNLGSVKMPIQTSGIPNHVHADDIASLRTMAIVLLA